MKRVCLVSSGSGGHLLPAVSLAHAMQRRGHVPSLLTEGRPVERELLASDDPAPALETGSLEVGRSNLGLPLSLTRATVQARRYLREHQVDVVVGTGGRTSVPATLAARSLGVPVFLLEQNVVTGRANRMLMPLARRIYYGLPPKRVARRGLLTGTPLRTRMGTVDRADARRELGFDPEDPVILVTGGSQGAGFLNTVVPEALAHVGRPLQVLHLAGMGADADVRSRYDPYDLVRALVHPVFLDMATAYAAADFVICRGGGGTVAELMVAGRGSLILPYPHHSDRQQWHNGRVLEAAGAALLFEESALDESELTRLVATLIRDPHRLADMGARASKLAPIDPCERILMDMTEQGALD